MGDRGDPTGIQLTLSRKWQTPKNKAIQYLQKINSKGKRKLQSKKTSRWKDLRDIAMCVSTMYRSCMNTDLNTNFKIIRQGGKCTHWMDI